MSLTGKTQVVALLGGLGTRLLQSEPAKPKALVDVHGKPFFQYQLDLMRKQGFKDFIFLVGHKAEMVMDYFGDGSDFGVNITYSSDDETPLGTGGALRKALPLLARDFILIYGDGYLDTDYDELIYCYRDARERGKRGLLTVFRNRDKYCPSNVVYKDGNVSLFDKWSHSPDMDYIDFGASMLSRSVIEELTEDRISDLADTYHQLAEAGELGGLEVRKRFYEIGTPESLEEFRAYIGLMASQERPAVFFDRDGTLNEIIFNEDTEQPDSPLKPEEMSLLPGVPEALRTIKSLGFLIVVVTNQPAAAKGKTTAAMLYEVNRKFADILAGQNAEPDGIIMCLHHPIGSAKCKERSLVGKCDCRKPAPGMIRRMAEKLNISIERSFVVGDSYVDVLAGKALGIETVFIGNYRCDTCKLAGGQTPDHVFDTVLDFAEYLKELNGGLNGTD